MNSKERIRISSKSKQDLEMMKLHPRELFDEVIQRIIKKVRVIENG